MQKSSSKQHVAGSKLQQQMPSNAQHAACCTRLASSGQAAGSSMWCATSNAKHSEALEVACGIQRTVSNMHHAARDMQRTARCMENVEWSRQIEASSQQLDMHHAVHIEPYCQFPEGVTSWDFCVRCS
jgi:hypothetical protein